MKAVSVGERWWILEDGRWLFDPKTNHEFWINPKMPNFCVCLGARPGGQCFHWSSYIAASVSSGRAGWNKRRKGVGRGGAATGKSIDFKKDLDFETVLKIGGDGSYSGVSLFSEFVTRGELTDQEVEALVAVLENNKALPTRALMAAVTLSGHPSTRTKEAAGREVVKFVERYFGDKPEAGEEMFEVEQIIIEQGIRYAPKIWSDFLIELLDKNEKDTGSIFIKLGPEVAKNLPKKLVVRLWQVKDKNLRIQLIGLAGQSRLPL